MSSTVTIEIKTVGVRARSLAHSVSEALGEDVEAKEAFMEECKKHIGNRAYHAFIQKILDMQDLLFVGRAETLIEGCFALLFQFLTNVDAERLDEVVDLLARSISKSQEHAVLRLRVLGELYNLLESGTASKVRVFREVVTYAAGTKQLHRLEPYFASADDWATKWGVSEDVLRSVYSLIANILEESDKSEDAQRFRIRYLKTFETATPEALADARDIAIASVIGYIKAPVVSQRMDLIDMKAVKAIAADARASRLYDLLAIFSSKGLREYLAFYAANGEAMKAWGIEHDQSLATMRLLTLCTLAGTADTIDYTAIAEALQVKDDDVERWVVRATTLGLVDAKINQLERRVVITRSVQRIFGKEEWAGLQRKLDAWKSNVGTLLSVVRDARSRHSV